MPPHYSLAVVFIENMKKHTLIVRDEYSIANETDADLYRDYHPGIWAIGSQRETLRYARELLAEGDHITVADFNKPEYHKRANFFIKELGLKQPLFPEAKPLAKTPVTNGKPSNLSELKRYLIVGREIIVSRYDPTGTIINEGRACILRLQDNLAILTRGGVKLLLEYGLASEWTFNNSGATKYFIHFDEYKPIKRLEYTD